jgi:hypothetical protein
LSNPEEEKNRRFFDLRKVINPNPEVEKNRRFFDLRKVINPNPEVEKNRRFFEFPRALQNPGRRFGDRHHSNRWQFISLTFSARSHY